MRRISELLAPESTVSLFELRRYLESTGWVDQKKLVGHRNSMVLQDNTGKEIEILLPRSDDLSDSGRIKLDAINVIAQLQDRDITQVITEVAAHSRDTLQFRVLKVDDGGNLPLDAAQHYLKGMKNLFLYAACSELQQKPFFTYPLPKAQKHLEEFRFGHTYKGSFGFSIYSNAIDENETPDILNQPPMPRRINQRIASGLSLLNESSSSYNADKLVSEYKTAFNSKMCDALVEMSMKGASSFECSIVWANSLAIDSKFANLPAFQIGDKEVDILEYVSEKLQLIEPETHSFEGLVTNLHCPRNPTDESSKRVIAVKGVHGEHGTIEVHMELGKRRYLKAIEAHKEGLKIVASGKLERKGSKWSMSEIRKFDLQDA